MYEKLIPIEIDILWSASMHIQRYEYTRNVNIDTVTPRSCWHGDVTATYIRRSEIPSRIYAKHQYKQESEYESKWCIIYSNIWVHLQSYHQRWSNITWILHHWYAQLREITKGCTRMNSTKSTHEFTKGNLERRTEGLEGWSFRWSVGDPSYCCTFQISN